jgi:hypothetical protein
MDSDQFTIFLNKVLRRTGTNFFNREEILTYIALQYEDSANNYDNRFQLYKVLCDKYMIRKNKAGHPDAFKGIKRANAESQTVQNEVSDMMEYLGKDVNNYSPELHDILD